MSPDTHSITHVIFDLDGTLINTETIIAHCLKSYAKKHGKENELTAEVETRFLGHPFVTHMQQILTDLELSVDLNQFVTEIISDIINYADTNGLFLMPGVLQLVEYFNQKNIPIAIASSNTSVLFKEINRRISGNFFDRFHHIVLGGDDEEVTHPKPNPDVFLVAARRFSRIPESMDQVLVFEDNEIGVEAAVAAGMKCVLIPDQRLYNTSIANSKANVVLRSMRDFNPQLFGL